MSSREATSLKSDRICLEIDKGVTMNVSFTLAQRLKENGMLHRMASQENQNSSMELYKTTTQALQNNHGYSNDPNTSYSKSRRNVKGEGSLELDLKRVRSASAITSSDSELHHSPSPWARRKKPVWGSGGTRRGEEEPRGDTSPPSSDEDVLSFSAPPSPQPVQRRNVSMKELFTRTDSLRRKLFKKKNNSNSPCPKPARKGKQLAGCIISPWVACDFVMKSVNTCPKVC